MVYALDPSRKNTVYQWLVMGLDADDCFIGMDSDRRRVIMTPLTEAGIGERMDSEEDEIIIAAMTESYDGWFAKIWKAVRGALPYRRARM